ncbi:Vegetative incompatibility protein HET-E-1 [Cercospora beticola]|uniref:Vegetative incompatibility protein HET-E-1 n=1 Tax=Cercospora beticola TaxID=122368 RepID=A0A2G5HBF0_CERBT|nr:Vegetative incompatibility protein HET-E-1 [Cercospora beticola]PIA89572.1 Vegetative incompatibility protein HET-E-1 [Cercospora beticola]
MSSNGPSSGQALANIQRAFESFQQTVKHDDARTFSSTALHDVWRAAKDVESTLAARQKARNLSKIQPFLDGLEHYSKAIEVLCNGTPYLPWIWPPIKLCLIIASDSIDAFEKLIQAYADIGEALPRFGLLADALKGNQDFQNVLALYYCDILSFHQRAYRLFTQNAWQRFFNTAWKRFDIHFSSILDDLKKHRNLVDAEANAHSIASIRQIAATCHDLREKAAEEAAAREKQRTDMLLPSVLAWLDVGSALDEDKIQRSSETCHPGSCLWFLNHNAVKRCLAQGSKNNKLWIHGKPGSGKSVLSVQLAQDLKSQLYSTVVFYMCDFRIADRNTRSTILRHVVAQLIAQHPDLAAFVQEEYMLKRREPSATCLKELIAALSSNLKSTRIIIDGLDESPIKEHQTLLKDLLSIVDDVSKTSKCTLMLFSRGIPTIDRLLKKQQRINLDGETEAVRGAIRMYVKHEISKFINEQDYLILTSVDIGNLEESIVEKADGMFLWVRLVLESLENIHSMHELRSHVEQLPKGLEAAYARVLHQFDTDLTDVKKTQIKRIFGWIAFAEQPLTIQEVLNGVVYSTEPYSLDEYTALTQAVLDLAKPLVEITPHGTISFVHFTVKEYVLHKDSGQTGPYLDRTLALRNIVLASCLSLWDSLDLVDPAVNQADALLRILKGHFSLQPYIAKNWLLHFQQFSKFASGDDGTCDDQLLTALWRLIHRHALLTAARNVSPPPLLIELRRTDLLQRVQEIPDCYVQVRWVMDESYMPSTDGRGQPQQDPNHDFDDATSLQPLCLVLEATRVLTSHMEDLMKPDAASRYSGIDPQMLDSFRNLNAPRALTCRVPDCSRRLDSYPDEAARDIHEHTHADRYLCSELSCTFNSAMGFGSAKALAAHRKRFHGESLPHIPVFRRTGIARSTSSGGRQAALRGGALQVQVTPDLQVQHMQQADAARQQGRQNSVVQQTDLQSIHSNLMTPGWRQDDNPKLPTGLERDRLPASYSDRQIYMSPPKFSNGFAPPSRASLVERSLERRDPFNQESVPPNSGLEEFEAIEKYQFPALYPDDQISNNERADYMSPPEINIDFAPPSLERSLERRDLFDQESFTELRVPPNGVRNIAQQARSQS